MEKHFTTTAKPCINRGRWGGRGTFVRRQNCKYFRNDGSLMVFAWSSCSSQRSVIHWLRKEFDSFVSDCVTQNMRIFCEDWVGYDVSLLRVPETSVHLEAVAHEGCPNVLSGRFETRAQHLLFAPRSTYIHTHTHICITPPPPKCFTAFHRFREALILCLLKL